MKALVAAEHSSCPAPQEAFWTCEHYNIGHIGWAQAGPVAATAGGKAPNTNGTEAHPTLALRGGLCGEFVDFGLLPALVTALNPEFDSPAVSRWADLLDERGFDSRHIDPDGGRLASTIAAEGAWWLANRIGLVRDGQMTEAGRAVEALAGIEAEARQTALVPLLRPGVESAHAGQGGKPILPHSCPSRTLATARRDLGCAFWSASESAASHHVLCRLMAGGFQCSSVSDWRSANAASVQKSHVQNVRCLSAAKPLATDRPRSKA